MNTTTAIIIFLLSGIITIINVNIDFRVGVLGMITFGMSLYGLAQFSDYINGSKTYGFIIPSLIVVLNYLVAVKARNIPAVEKPSFNKKSFIIIIPIYFFVIYANIDEIINRELTEVVILFIVSVFVAFFFYFWLREIVFSYLLIWMHYYLGRKSIYNNKKIEMKVTRYKNMYNYYFIIDGRQLSVNKQMIQKYFKNRSSVSDTKSMTIRQSLISKRVMITEMW